MKEFKLMRRTRPDGNCFFRGFTFAYFEFLLASEEELDKFIELVDKCKDMLVKSGFLFFTIEDFHDTVSFGRKRITAPPNSFPPCDIPSNHALAPPLLNSSSTF